MPAKRREIQQLATDLSTEHNDVAVAAACLIQLTRTLFRGYAKQQSINLDPLLTLQALAIKELVNSRGVACGEVHEALQGLERAGRTVGYLESIPD